MPKITTLHDPTDPNRVNDQPGFSGPLDIFTFKIDGRIILLNNSRFNVSFITPIEAEILDTLYSSRHPSGFTSLSHTHGAQTVALACQNLARLGVLPATDAAETTPGGMAAPMEPPLHFPRSICLSVSDDCNLRCRYCWHHAGPLGATPARMTTDIAKAALEFFLAESGPHEQCFLYLNGGEPSLNFDVAAFCIRYGPALFRENGKNLTVYFVTNGFRLPQHMIDFLAENNVTIIIGIDGPPGIHDARRRLPDGSGSYEAVVRSIARIRSTPRSRLSAICVIACVDENVVDIVNHIRSLGIDNVVLKPVIRLGRETGHLESGLERVIPAITELSHDRLGDIFQRIPRPHKYLINETLIETYVSLIWKKIHGCLPATDRSGRCAAGLEELGVTAKGDIYPCVFFFGLEEYRLGNVRVGYDREKLNRFIFQTQLDRMTLCRDCWAKYICSGGCLRDSVGFSGRVDKPDRSKCTFNRELIKLALYRFAAIMERDESAIQYFVGSIEYTVAKLCGTFS